MPKTKTEHNEEVARLLRRRQAELGLTHAELAEKITKNGYQVSTETVARWHRTGAIPVEALVLGRGAIAKAHGLSVNELPTLDKNMPMEWGTAVTVGEDGPGDIDADNPELFVARIDVELKHLENLYAELEESKAGHPQLPIRNGHLNLHLTLAALNAQDIERDIQISMERLNRLFGDLGRQTYHRLKKVAENQFSAIDKES